MQLFLIDFLIFTVGSLGFMKNLDKTYAPKKSATLDKEAIQRFLLEYDKNEPDSLIIKVSMILGIYGALRVSEIINIHFEDIRHENGNYVVHIKTSKTDQAGIGFEFIITPKPMTSICPCDYLTTYISLFQKPEGRFLRRFNKNGQPTNQALGVNTVATFPSKVAAFLNLPGDYTGHCFRRSSATILADAGANNLQLKRHGRWKSQSVAEGYVDSSKTAKLEISSMINGTKPLGNPVEFGKLGNCSFNNCNVNITFH